MDLPITDLIIIAVASIVMIGFFYYFFFMKKKDRFAKFLYFSTEHTCELLDLPVKDGSVIVKEGKQEKIFDVDKTKPKNLKLGNGWIPFYFLKWNSVAPLNVELTNNKMEDIKITPSSLAQMKNSDIIEKLLHPKKDDFNLLLYIIIFGMGVAIGALVVYQTMKGSA